RALELGADALEMDVHLTPDGHLVVAHDDDARRTTGVPRAWTDMTLEEIERLDAGWGFIAKDGSRPFAGHGIRVPRFEDVLAAFPDVAINVDLKVGAVEVALELLRRVHAVDRVRLASFQLATLVDAR